MKNASSKSAQPKATPGRGDVAPDAREVIALVEWARAQGLTPTAVQFGAARIELAPLAPATNIAATTDKDRRGIYNDYGGAAYERFIAQRDDNELGDDEDVPAVTQ